MGVCMRLAILIAMLPAAVLAQDFKSPTGNVHCTILAESAELRCDVIEVQSVPPRPEGCDLDWGHAFGLSAQGPGRLLCVGDTVVHPESEILDYGQVIRGPGITCLSGRDGMTCTNAEGQGFKLSRRVQRLF